MAAVKPATKTNLEVDYVISYRFTDESKATAAAEYEKLIQDLARVGLQTEVRNGDSHSLLIFVRVGDASKFSNELYRSRVRDWLHGVRAAEPNAETEGALTKDKLTEAERFRILHSLITRPKSEGGAGIVPKQEPWQNVESLFPLHDHVFNKNFMSKWSRQTTLKTEDLDEIRDRFGEKIAFYFAFTQSYFTFLFFPALFGFSCWLMLGSFSPIYAIVASLWTVTFVEYWKHQEIDLGIRWGVRGVSTMEEKRKDFQHEKEVKDPITGETTLFFSSTKRLARQSLQIPFALLAVVVLGGLISTTFGIEIFLSEVYNGPFKGALIYLPTGILTTILPTLTALMGSLAKRLNDFENYQTKESYDNALTAKTFVLNFITSYLPIFLTAFVYVPFGSVIVPYLDVFGLTVRPFAENEVQMTAPKVGFQINTARLHNQVIYFTVTAQIVGFGLEVVMPYIKRKVFTNIQSYKSSRAAKHGGAPADAAQDPKEEVDFLRRVRDEATLDIYDVTGDIREMVVQFGYLALFSVVWPLAPVSFLINNWVELRSDAFKICVEMQRPTPQRADSIGPWLDSLSLLSWLGSITMSALVYLFSGNEIAGPDGKPAGIKGWALLLTIAGAEHLYILVRLAVRFAISHLDSPGMQKERAERYQVRKKYLQEQYGENAVDQLPPKSQIEAITRSSLEEEQRNASLAGVGPSDRFWARQKGWEETAQVGKRLIEQLAAMEEKKDR